MAGMLPGVECARRRRVHQSGGGWPDSPRGSSTRSPSFCLYVRKIDSNVSSIPSVQRSWFSQAHFDDKLGDAAREAKERLDERLNQRKPDAKTAFGGQKQEPKNRQQNQAVMPREMQMVVFEKRKKGSKRFSWAKLSWKPSDQNECAVCLEQFREGETLMHLPCAHSFHSRCLLPWLQSNSHCPCCRTEF